MASQSGAVTALSVALGDAPVGTIVNLPGDVNLFTFFPEYLHDPDRPVLSQYFLNGFGDVIAQVPPATSVLPPFFSNLLFDPDSRMRTYVARAHGINRRRDFPMLAVLGEDLPGAVIARLAAGSVPRESPEDADAPVAPDLLRFSLAGMQLKFSAGMKNSRLTVPLYGNETAWIAKLPNSAYPRLTENEYATMAFARDIGIDVPEIQLVSRDHVTGIPDALLESGEPVYAIRRFDRGPAGARIHAEDFNQIAGQPSEEKYTGKDTEWILRIVHVLCGASGSEELLRRLVFTIATGNDDMHLKNWSLLYADGRTASLAPAYDFVPTSVYTKSDLLALSVGGERRLAHMTREHLLDAAFRSGISRRLAGKAIDAAVERIRSIWPNAKERYTDPTAQNRIAHLIQTVPILN